MAHEFLASFCGGNLVPAPADAPEAGDKPCGITFLKGRGAAAFDDTDEEAAFTPRFVMPSQYAGGTLKATIGLLFDTETDVEDEAVFDIRVEAVTAGDALDLTAAHSFDSANVCEVDPPATAGYETEVTVTLANKDSVAAGDRVVVAIRRDTDHENDSAAGDVFVTTIELWEET